MLALQLGWILAFSIYMFMPENATTYGGNLEFGCLERNLSVSLCPNVNLEKNAGTCPLFIMAVL